MADALSVTIPPFSNQKVLPACAEGCQPLWDANGGCVPPAVQQAPASAYTACFCQNKGVAPFSKGVAGVCDNACDQNGLSSIGNWFKDICSVDSGSSGNSNSNNGGKDDSSGSSSDSGSSSSNAAKSSSKSDNGDWLSHHWQWVVFLAVLVSAIAIIWVGACIWRRKHLKKKERQQTAAQKQSGSRNRPSWGPEASESQNATRPEINPSPPSDDPRTAGSFMPNAQEDALQEKPTSRWNLLKRSS